MAKDTIDIFNIEPHKVSRDLRGYTMMFYGEPKTGKTTIASHFPKSLLLAFEVGYLAIPGIRPQICRNWSDFKKVLSQLASNAGPDSVYQNIIIDTADICFEYAERFICKREGVENIGDIPYGGGYKMVQIEFDRALRQIPQMGYGLVMISHSMVKTVTDSQGKEYSQIIPTLPNKANLVVSRMSDIIGYAEGQLNEEGETHTFLHMRGTPRFLAGSRFRYTPATIPFNYDALVEAIGNAIDEEATHSGESAVTNERTDVYTSAQPLNFHSLMEEFNGLVNSIRSNVSEEDFSSKWGPRIASIVSGALGKSRKVKDLTPDQAELLDVIVEELRTAVGEGL